MEKLLKGNQIFIKDKIVLDFIKYCKETYSKDIRKIELSLYDEKDACENEWQINVSECSDNNEQGTMWLSWHIPTTKPIIIGCDKDMSKLSKKVSTKYYGQLNNK